MKRISRAALTAFCTSTLALGGIAVGITGAPAEASPYDAPSTRQALATSVVLGGVTTAVPVETTTTLPLLGAPLTVDITSGPGGNLSSIAVNPATGLTATTVKSNKVRFVNDAGTAKVEISSRGGGQNVSAKAGQLTDVAGPGSWSGDVFGTGTATTVNFTTVANPDGSPGITAVTTSDATAEIGTVHVGSHDDSQIASVSIRFTSGIQARVLTIKVGVSTHDDQTNAKVSVSLSRITGQSLPSADVVGQQTWNGVLCDGTAATIAYTVNADGTVSDTTATPTADIHGESSKGALVTFSNSERVRIRVKSSDDGATLRVSVDERIRCDAADPSVNTPVSTTLPDDHGDDQGGDHGGNHSGDHQGGDQSGSGQGGDDGATHDAGDDHGTDATGPATTVAGTTVTTLDDHGGESGDESGSGSHSGHGSDDGGGGSNHG